MTVRARRRAACLLVLCALCLPWPAAVAEDTPAPEEGAALQGAETPLPEEGATGTGAETPLPEESPTQPAVEPPVLTAADVAYLMRNPEYVVDVTGNGSVDEADFQALLLHAADVITDLEALPAVLADSLIGEQALDRFCYTGVQSGDGYYRSETISYRLNIVETEQVTYYVADILLRDLSHFRTAFGRDTYGKSEFVVDMAERNNAIITINGDYFTGSANDGPVIRNGVLYRDSIDRNRDACVLYQDGTVETYAPDEIDVEEMMARGAYQCWTFGPSLLDEEGQPKTEKSQFLSTVQRANPRSALGYVAPGHYLFVTVDGRGQSGSRGMTMAELSRLMYDLGCTVAYNLDGGGTAIMADQDGAISNQSNDERRCSDILFIVEDVSAYQQATEEDE